MYSPSRWLFFQTHKLLQNHSRILIRCSLFLMILQVSYDNGKEWQVIEEIGSNISSFWIDGQERAFSKGLPRICRSRKIKRQTGDKYRILVDRNLGKCLLRRTPLIKIACYSPVQKISWQWMISLVSGWIQGALSSFPKMPEETLRIRWVGRASQPLRCYPREGNIIWF